MDNDAPESTASDNTLLGGFTPEQGADPAAEEGQAQAEAPKSDSWYGAYSDDTKSLIDNLGYTKLDQNEAFESLSGSYKNLQSKLGGNHDELFKITAEMTPEDRASVYAALGRPETAEGYTYETQEGDSPELVDSFKSIAHELGLTENQVSKFIPMINEKIVGIATGHTDEINAQNNAGLEALQKEWGGSWDSKLNIATRAAEHFGITSEMQQAIVEGGHSAEFIKALNGIGSLMAEGAMVGMSATDQKASIGAMSKQEAQNEINAKTGDPEFRARLSSTDRKVSEQASQELEKYYKVLAG